MFVLPTDLGFARPDTRAPLRAAFDELCATIIPLAGDRDPETLTEIAWSALHGLATLTRAGRLRPDYQQQRIELLMIAQPRAALTAISSDVHKRTGA